MEDKGAFTSSHSSELTSRTLGCENPAGCENSFTETLQILMLVVLIFIAFIVIGIIIASLLSVYLKHPFPKDNTDRVLLVEDCSNSIFSQAYIKHTLFNIGKMMKNVSLCRKKEPLKYQQMVNSSRTEDVENYYQMFERLGSGRFAEVRRCFHMQTCKEYAAKIMNKRSSSCTHLRIQSVSEVEILSSISHPNIIRMFEVYESPFEIVFITELASGGDLFEYLDRNKGLREDKAVGIVYQLACAITYLHENNIIHRDIKPENVFFDSSMKVVKLGDFGFARRITEGSSKIREICGTAEFIAPEILAGKHWTKACDMWAFGVMVYNIFSGLSPFLGLEQRETYANIAAGVFSYPKRAFQHVSENGLDFIDKLLILEPSKRMCASDCLKHPLLDLMDKGDTALKKKRGSDVELVEHGLSSQIVGA
eukprot:Nk52_evm57s1992 gene=Nk52_evmTU57s1992